MRRAGGLLCIVASAAALGADAPKAEIKSRSVLGARAGHKTNVVFYGDNLAPTTITASKPQVQIKLVSCGPTTGDAKPKGAIQVTTEITASADCPRENIDVTLIQPDKTKVTTQLPIIDDVADEIPVKKPNGSYRQAMPLPGPSVAIDGALDGDTASTFRIDAKAGETWELSLLAGRGGSALDALLRVRDSHHLALALDAGNPKHDRHITFRSPADGPYYIEITDDQARGGPTFTYILTAKRK